MSESSLKPVEVNIRRNIDLAVNGMSKEMSHRGAADVFKWWMFMAADVIGELSFGESFKMLESGKVGLFLLDGSKLTEMTEKSIHPGHGKKWTCWRHSRYLPVHGQSVERDSNTYF